MLIIYFFSFFNRSPMNISINNILITLLSIIIYSKNSLKNSILNEIIYSKNSLKNSILNEI